MNRRSQRNTNEEKKQTKLLSEQTQYDRMIFGTMLPRVPDVTPIKLKSDKVYTFTRVYNWTSVITAVQTIESDYQLSFTLDSLPGYTDFTALFDQYRIIQATVQFQPINGYTLLPNVIHTVIDYDDDSTTPITDLLQYQTLISRNGAFTRTLNPRLAGAVYSGTFTSFANLSNKTWLDSASPSVAYYGLKIGVPPLAVAGSPVDIYAPLISLVVQFRNPR